jgi:hypothetical protein
MIVTVNSKSFEKTMFNLFDYSVGFLEGINKGKTLFYKNLSMGIIEGLSRYVDANARINPQALQHVYEWYKNGSPESRLFDLTYVSNDFGISINSTFKQSKTISNKSNAPFYNKARIMELGIPVTIKPKTNSVLAFEENGKSVFTKKPIKIQYPGGPEARGSYEKTFDQFFKLYFSQSFLKASGLLDYLENPKAYKNNFSQGSIKGKSLGVETGFSWIVSAKIGVE